ncbi:MAG: pitrilysin family protein [Candidatus Saccharimonadales bacterium]|nr:pitrilysin family protein [Candidatus Saccharimonadales bacterium]
MKHRFKQVKLDSGSQGILVDIPGSTIVNMEFTFMSGYEFVEQSKYEVPHSMEHLILGANDEYRTATAFSREFGLNGARHNAYTDSVLNGYYAETADFEWDRIMKLFWTGLTTPKFLPSEFKTEQETVREELSSRLMNYQLAANITLEQAMGDVYALDYKSRLDLLPGITTEDLHRHYQATHSAPNMRFVVAGDLSDKRDDIIRILERSTRRLPDGERAQRPEQGLVKPLGPIVLAKDVDKTFFALKMGNIGELNERELVTLQLIAYTLAGSWDSRIFGKGREKGLLYSIHGRGGNSAGTTGLTLFGSVVPEKGKRLFKFIADELAEFIRNGMTEDELRDAKQHNIGSFQIGFQTAQHMVNWYSRFFSYDDVFDFEARAALIKSITRNDVQRVIHKVMHTNTWGFAVLGKKMNEAKAEPFYKEIEKIWRT